MILTPEIGLIPQLVDRFRKRFGLNVFEYHSNCSMKEKNDTWKRSLDTSIPSVFIGTRSAIFLPFKKLGLIIVDEEHDNSFKETNKSPRFCARDCVTVLSKIMNSKLLIGSATPSVESFYNTEISKYSLVELNERYQNIPLPIL